MSGLYGNPVGGGSLPKTLILTDENGVEVVGVVVGQKTVFDATEEDVKIGKTFASDSGVMVGTDTRTYRTYHASCAIFPGESFTIPLSEYDQYNYTEFQAMIAEFNTSSLDSTSVSKVSLNNAVYNEIGRAHV